MRPMWDERYGGEDYFYGTDPSDFLVEHLGLLPPGGELLCLAEGEGRNAVFLAERGFRPTGVDQSPVGLAKAQRLAAARGVTIDTVVADLTSYDLGSARWDAVVSVWAHLPPEIKAVVNPRIARAVKPGGILFLEHYHPNQIPYGTGGPKDPSWMMTLDELRRDFGDWEWLHSAERERNVIEGAGHGGLSYVTQLIARKP